MRNNKDLIKLTKIIKERKQTLKVISNGTKDTSALLEAVVIAEKQERGEQISQEEKKN